MEPEWDAPTSTPLTESTAIAIEDAYFSEDAYLSHGPADQRDTIEAEIRRRIIPALRRRALASTATETAYRDMLSSMRRIAEGLFESLHSNNWDSEPNKKPRAFWHHQQFDPFRTNDETRGFAIEKEGLLWSAAEYLRNPEVQTNRFDWIFLDSIVLAELDAFCEHVVLTRAGTGFNWAAACADHSRLKYYGYRILFGTIGVIVGYVVPFGVAYFLWSRGHEAWAIATLGIWALVVLRKLLTYPFRFRARQRARKLLQHLTELYAALGHTTISPTTWRSKLEIAIADGVVLDGAVFAIIDRAIARDPTAFIMTQ